MGLVLDSSVVMARSGLGSKHATVANVDALVSWNFRHVVNLARIHAYHGVNAELGYPTIEIRSPREVLADE